MPCRLNHAAVRTPGTKVPVPPSGARVDDLHVLKGLIEAGMVAPVIDRTYTLSDVPDAMRYLEGRHARGKVVVTVRGAERDTSTSEPALTDQATRGKAVRVPAATGAG